MAGRTRKIISAVIRIYPHPLITASIYLRQRIMAT